ncbi:MAG: D-sedoheptulose 7-phosphate isomerase [Oligoflexia bacterium]|nr:D-sedoheptulose 7-phosphate isomerase [Oligoflexia bacterium]
MFIPLSNDTEQRHRQRYIEDSLGDAHRLLTQFLREKENTLTIETVINQMVTTIRAKGKIMACGNGGSMCDAMHFAEELTGRFNKDRPPIAAIAISDPSHLTCTANDFGYDEIFSRTILALGKKEDTLLAISTSGNSPNVLKAVASAKEIGMRTVGLTGKGGGKLKDLCDIAVVVNEAHTERIQEMHIKLIHILIGAIEREIYPDN